MNIRPTISFSNRLSWREFDTEMWRLYFGFVKGFLMVVASVLYIVILPAFFLIQNLTFLTAKLAGWVIDWNPEKPKAFGLNQVDVDGD
jgi:hypothetical protein